MTIKIAHGSNCKDRLLTAQKAIIKDGYRIINTEYKPGYVEISYK